MYIACQHIAFKQSNFDTTCTPYMLYMAETR